MDSWGEEEDSTGGPPFVYLQELVDSRMIEHLQTIVLSLDGKQYGCYLESGLFDATYEEAFLVYYDADKRKRIREANPLAFVKSMCEHLGSSPDSIPDSGSWSMLIVQRRGENATLEELAREYLAMEQNGIDREESE